MANAALLFSQNQPSAIAPQDTRYMKPGPFWKASLSLLFQVTAQGNGVLRVLFDDLLHKRYAQRCCIAVWPSKHMLHT